MTAGLPLAQLLTQRLPWRTVEAALAHLTGCPFRRGARGPEAYDCWGVVLEVRRRLGLVLPPDPATDVDLEQAAALFASVERPAGWRAGPATLGAIVLSPGGAHAGVHLAGRILHAQAGAGVCTWSLGHWAARYGPLEFWEWEATP